MGQAGNWWCSDEESFSFDADSYFKDLLYNSAIYGGFVSYWPTGYSVRCMTTDE
jgi:hypothetical protein